ncbi:unnamed protein product [Schistosoma curassoni]|uniref:Uncharacterized protein n=1 Tax=Schistosoma curassoni TaxID=6186 RepID=A0A183KLL8_9TREM|nr:unnamed protein product [Schistosoma curassoni]
MPPFIYITIIKCVLHNSSLILIMKVNHNQTNKSLAEFCYFYKMFYSEKFTRFKAKNL